MKVKIISETIQEFRGQRYYLCDRYFQKKGQRLHRQVWIHHYGDIPEGYHVHHKDHNTHNNDITNLELIPKGEHLKYHANRPEAKEYGRYKMEKYIRPKAIEWHKSEAGRKWHSKQSKENWQKLEPRTCHCEQCGEQFEVRVTHKQTRFGSNKCKSKWRRDNGLDNELRICVICQKEFSVNKYKKTKTCSRECGAKASGNKRKKGS